MRWSLIPVLLVALTTQTLGGPDPTLDLPVEPKKWENFYKTEDPKEPPGIPAVTEVIEPEAPVFFSQEIPLGEKQSLVYVLDFSWSMSAVYERVDYRTTKDRWEKLVEMTQASIEGLSPSIKFDLVVFGTQKGCGVMGWRKRPVPATAPHKASALAWLAQFHDVIIYGGATPAGPAVLVALEMDPGVIALLTDGYPSACGITGYPWESHRQLIQTSNEDGVRIDVFGFCTQFNQYAREFAQGVAADSSGTFYDIR